MTFHQPNPNPLEETAADRVREFLAARDDMVGDHDVVSRVLTMTKGIDLTVHDLRILIQQADALRHHAEVQHMILENHNPKETS